MNAASALIRSKAWSQARLLLAKAGCFIVRDFIIESSYRGALLTEVLRSLFPVVSFYFIAKLVHPIGRGAGTGEYFPFVLVGLALTQYLFHALHSFGATVRRAQLAGCLEAMISTRTSPELIIALSPLYSFLSKSLHVFLIFAFAAIFLNVDFALCNYPAAFLTLALSAMVFSGVGIFLAAAIVILKRGDAIEWTVATALSFVSGAYFPVEMLPQSLQILARFSPLTYSVDAMRKAIFQGTSIAEMRWDFAILLVMIAITLPVGIWTFGHAIARGRRDGTLLHH